MASKKSGDKVDPKLIPETGLFWPCHIQKGWDLDDPNVITEERFLCPDHQKVLESVRAFNTIKSLGPPALGKKMTANNPPRSLLFWQAFIKSEYVFFADKYFEDDNVHEVIIDEIQKGSINRHCPKSIVIFSDTRKPNELARRILTRLSLNRTGQCSIEVFNFPSGYEIHDRFALFDSKIWHCGSTVGGIHQAFHAISGPWEDIGDGMRNLFQKMISNASK